jgi:hypothetical protein
MDAYRQLGLSEIVRDLLSLLLLVLNIHRPSELLEQLINLWIIPQRGWCNLGFRLPIPNSRIEKTIDEIDA